MTREPRRTAGAGRHLDLERTLDFLEDRLTPAAARAVEEHLATPCAACRERVREAGTLLERMRADRVREVPEVVRRRALDVFVPAPAGARSRGLAARLAELVFDSLAQPLPAAARRAVGEARRLRFSLADDVLELELEHEGARTLALRGRLAIAEPALHAVEVENAGETRTAWPDASGRFAVEGLSPGRLGLTVHGPAGRFRVPPFTI